MIPCGFWGGLQETTTALLLKGLAAVFMEFSPDGAKKENNTLNNEHLNAASPKLTFWSVKFSGTFHPQTRCLQIKSLKFATSVNSG